jgi:NAD(P)H-hydrate epimerase
MVRELLPLRPREAHKGTFGTALIIAGSVNYTGAALLAGMAAYRVGVGLVTMGVPVPLHSVLAGEFPEGTWLLLPHEMGVIAEGAEDIVRENLGSSSAMLLGPGFGMEDTTRNFLKNLFVSTQRIRKSRIGFVSVAEKEMEEQHAELPPAVIDADGLKLLSKIDGWPGMISSPAVLTPHPGEMSVMTGLPVNEIQADRIGNAERFAKEWRHIVVLKGANTVIAEPDGRTCVVPVADPALARAGSGDVLAGVITSLRAQGLSAYEAALCGAWIHAQSGLFAAKKLGTSSSVIAGDLITELPSVFQFLAR